MGHSNTVFCLNSEVNNSVIDWPNISVSNHLTFDLFELLEYENSRIIKNFAQGLFCNPKLCLNYHSKKVKKQMRCLISVFTQRSNWTKNLTTKINSTIWNSLNFLMRHFNFKQPWMKVTERAAAVTPSILLILKPCLLSATGWLCCWPW